MEARGADRGTDAAEHLAVESGVHFLGRELDTGDSAVMADAEAAQTESGECILSTLDLFENFLTETGQGDHEVRCHDDVLAFVA